MAAGRSYRGFCRICGVAVGAAISFGTCKLLLQKKQSLLYARFVEKDPSSELKLVQVQIAFRHGARTPVCPPPPVDGIEELCNWDKDELMGDLPHTILKNYVVNTADGKERPFSEIDKRQLGRILKGGASMGQLTKVGQQQMFVTGRRLQETYVNQLELVNKDFNPSEVFLRTTNMQRTIDSLRCVLAGIFGQDGINVPAVAITFPAEEERWYPNLHCKRLKTLASHVYGTMDLLPGYSKDMIKFAKAIGKENEKINFVTVRDFVVAMMAHGMELPDVIRDNMEVIEKRATQLIHTVHVNVPFHSQEALRLGVGNFLEDIYNKMQSKVVGESKHKLCLYSVHDTSVIALLSSLSIFNNQWPPYGALLAFELYSDKNDQHFVKVLYNEQEKVIPECGGVYCPLDRFRKIVKSYSVHDWDKECLPLQH